MAVDDEEELIPEAQNGEHSNIGTIGTAVGFALMMVFILRLLLSTTREGCSILEP